LPEVSRVQIVKLIEQGLVRVDGKTLTKPGQQVRDEALVECDFAAPKYVSRAGLKLEHALKTFAIDVSGKIALDAGLSTGGFADCLLQHGALKIYGVDVGTNQAHAKIKADQRVLILEQTNLRYLAGLPEPVDLVTLDLSFISLLKVVPNVLQFLKPGGILMTLIKPQFEVGPGQVGSGGIVKDVQVREQAVQAVIAGIVATGFLFGGLINSPITGGDGNHEYLAYFVVKK
jgi:23S rRNA (cytidine1920-2'-O)/16S rRNA (cytidine1409-2'-O)-methyltransferase